MDSYAHVIHLNPLVNNRWTS